MEYVALRVKTKGRKHMNVDKPRARITNIHGRPRKPPTRVYVASASLTYFMRNPPADVYPRENRPSCQCSAVVPNLRAVSAWRIPLTYTPLEKSLDPAQSPCCFRLAYTPDVYPRSTFARNCPAAACAPRPDFSTKSEASRPNPCSKSCTK